MLVGVVVVVVVVVLVVVVVAVAGVVVTVTKTGFLGCISQTRRDRLRCLAHLPGRIRGNQKKTARPVPTSL